ncbi:MAG: ABC transporter permease [Oscillospiraceae bacterium]|jgi:ABC-2 type transport system permease protein
MFVHAFSYNLKTILRSRESVFWSLVFPLVLATLFHFAFGRLGSVDRFETVSIAVTESSEILSDEAFYGALSAVSNIDGVKGEDDIFDVKLTSLEEADSLLQRGYISAYITYKDGLKLVVSDSGYGQTLAKLFLDEYQQRYSTIRNILSENPGAAGQEFFSEITRWKQYMADGNEGAAGKENTTVIYFYALLAMTCLMGSTVAVEEIIKLQANMSPRAARVNLAPVRKFYIFLCNILSLIVFQVFVIALVLAYMVLGLKVDFGGRVWLILLTCVLGAITGIFFGTAVSVGFRTQGIKYAITIGFTMLSSFLSGLMVAEMKYWVHEYIPVLGYISPANLITDALYSLYYYDGLSRYLLNMGVLSGLAAALCAFTCLAMGRKRYASL